MGMVGVSEGDGKTGEEMLRLATPIVKRRA